MRVIAGSAKGVPLHAPKGGAIRPTLDRVRESLFNILGPRLEGGEFLDLFAGTGANGIEALSRGAARCGFVDREKRALDLVRRNLHATGLEENARLWRLALPGGLKTLVAQAAPFDVIFADPPRKFNDFEDLLRKVFHGNLVKMDGIFVLEHAPRDSPWIERPEGEDGAFQCVRTETYGRSALSFFGRNDSS